MQGHGRRRLGWSIVLGPGENLDLRFLVLPSLWARFADPDVGFSFSLALLQTFYTQDAFRTPPKPMLSQTTQCSFAHQASEFVSPNPSETNSLVFCTAFYPFSDDDSKKGEPHSIADSRLFASSDWFNKFEMVDFGLGKRAQGVVGLGVIKKFVVAALRPETADGEMNLFGMSPFLVPFPPCASLNRAEEMLTPIRLVFQLRLMGRTGPRPSSLTRRLRHSRRTPT